MGVVITDPITEARRTAEAVLHAEDTMPTERGVPTGWMSPNLLVLARAVMQLTGGSREDFVRHLRGIADEFEAVGKEQATQEALRAAADLLEVHMPSHHRAVGGMEHDPARSLLHGCCAVCVTPWPCSHEQALAAAEIQAIERRSRA
jgi:threonine dehydrogenase-like Zn-dependent dehydrogenase